MHHICNQHGTAYSNMNSQLAVSTCVCMLASHGKGSYLVLHSEIVQGLLQLVDEQISLALLHPGLVERVHDLQPMTHIRPADSKFAKLCDCLSSYALQSLILQVQGTLGKVVQQNATRHTLLCAPPSCIHMQHGSPSEACQSSV